MVSEVSAFALATKEARYPADAVRVIMGREGSMDRSIRMPRNLSRKREFVCDVLKMRNWAWRQW